MTAISARVMVPVRVVSDMVLAGSTVPEPNEASGEMAWLASGAYTAGDERTAAGSVWLCRQDHEGRTATPDTDLAYWLRIGPTERMAPFDDYTATKARAMGTISYEILTSFVGAVRVYGAVGDTCTITVRDGPGGAVLKTQTFALFSQAAGFYELLYTMLPPIEQVGMDDLPIRPGTTVTVTVTAGDGTNAPVAIGDIKLGDWRSLIGDSAWGGAEYGASAERKSYTYREYAKDGTYSTVLRPGSRDVSCSVKLSGDQAMYADAVLGEILDLAVPFQASDLPRYGYLNTLGFVTGSISPDSFGVATLQLHIKGNI